MFTSSRAWRLDEAIPVSISASTIFVVFVDSVTWGTSLNPSLSSLADNDFKSPLNSAFEIRIASFKAASPWINFVTFSASAFCASRKWGASFFDCSNRLISSFSKKVKY